jgi:hypothetical protein
MYLLAQSIRGTIFSRMFVQLEITYEDGRDLSINRRLSPFVLGW